MRAAIGCEYDPSPGPYFVVARFASIGLRVPRWWCSAVAGSEAASTIAVITASRRRHRERSRQSMLSKGLKKKEEDSQLTYVSRSHVVKTFPSEQ